MQILLKLAWVCPNCICCARPLCKQWVFHYEPITLSDRVPAAEWLMSFSKKILLYKTVLYTVLPELICCSFSLIPHLSMYVHSVPGDVWQSRQSQPCLALPLWRSSSCLSAPVPSSSKELQVSSESIVRANGSPVCVTFSFLSLMVPIPVLISLVTSPVHGGSLAGYEVIQYVSVGVAHAAFGQSVVIFGENVIRQQI